MNILIHELAHVSFEAKTGNETKIWINSQVMEHTHKGEN